MPFYHVIHRDPANREIIATEEPIDAPDPETALFLFVSMVLPAQDMSSNDKLIAAYDQWVRSHGKWAEYALYNRLEVRKTDEIESEAVPL